MRKGLILLGVLALAALCLPPASAACCGLAGLLRLGAAALALGR